MSTDDVVTGYLQLGLRFDRVVDGFVDAYLGDPALRDAVLAEPAPVPADLQRQALDLLAALPEAGLDDQRTGFLHAHLHALERNAARLTGEEMTLVEEVSAYFQVDIELGDPQVYADAHRELDDLLPGSGDVGDRLRAVRAAEACPPELVETAVQTLAGALRELVAERAGLDREETIEFGIERDVAWSGFNYYLGNFRSKVAVNADVGHRMSQLPVLVAHECYPGHHTEHCRKEDLLVRSGGQLEQTIFLVNTPQCVMAEGLGDLALDAILGDGWASWAQQVLAGIGPSFDPELATALEIAARPLNSVRQDAAILVHDRGADAETALAHLQRWSLVDRPRAEQQLRFLTDPLWRAYGSTYVEGEKLLRPWLAARPAGQDAFTRFRRLLDEPLTPAGIRAELATTPGDHVRG